MTTRPGLGDILILLAATTLVVTLFAIAPGGAGTWANVHVDDQRVARFDLNRPGEYTIDGPLGPTRLAIADGAIRFIESPCRAQRCVHSGWQRRAGATAACLPNRMVVQVVGRDSRYDSLVF